MAPTETDTNHVEASHEHVAEKENPNVTFQDIWENRRVLSFVSFSEQPNSGKFAHWFFSGFLIFMLPINFGYEINTVGNLLAVVPFMERFGKTVDGTLLVPAQDQQILNAATTVGIFVSAFATGWISDLIGRKKTIGVACLICVAGILVQFFAKNIS
ncbi:maltose permease [Fusarium albosuccineum]|uniref:Maltose permease n=1 Tax=Fusarium albosuccineum TaxID=1237068 RepID=A0A8H4L1F7_9HYPO|nr:maltose permease [Fusarium albosuccineum]